MRLPFQFDLLAKLREYKKGSNPASYLLNDQRQNLTAIQGSYVEVKGVPIVIASIPTVLTANQKYALNENNCALLNEKGTLKDGVFYPKADGTFFLEYGFQSSIPAAAGVYGPSVAARNDLDVVFDSLSGLTNKTSTDAEYIYPNTGLFVNITSKNGIYFYATISSASYISRFYCKITSLS